VGLYEFFFTVPAVADGDYQINVTLGGVKIPQTLFLSVKSKLYAATIAPHVNVQARAVRKRSRLQMSISHGARRGDRFGVTPSASAPRDRARRRCRQAWLRSPKIAGADTTNFN